MLSIPAKPFQKRRTRRKTYPTNQAPPAAPILITGASPTGTLMVLTFNQPVVLGGTPAYNAAGKHAVSAVQTTPTSVSVTFSGSVTAATSLDVGYRDPAIRTTAGGYVTSTTLAIDPT